MKSKKKLKRGRASIGATSCENIDTSRIRRSMGTETMEVHERLPPNLSREIHACTRLCAWILAAECTSSGRKPDIPEALWWRCWHPTHALSPENFLLLCGFCTPPRQKCTHARASEPVYKNDHAEGESVQIPRDQTRRFCLQLKASCKRIS